MKSGEYFFISRMRARFTSDSVGDFFTDLTTDLMVRSMKASAEPAGIPRARASRVRDFLRAAGSKV